MPKNPLPMPETDAYFCLRANHVDKFQKRLTEYGYQHHKE